MVSLCRPCFFHSCSVAAGVCSCLQRPKETGTFAPAPLLRCFAPELAFTCLGLLEGTVALRSGPGSAKSTDQQCGLPKGFSSEAVLSRSCPHLHVPYSCLVGSRESPADLAAARVAPMALQEATAVGFNDCKGTQSRTFTLCADTRAAIAPGAPAALSVFGHLIELRHGLATFACFTKDCL